jgi:hypothetical protein
VADTKDTGEEKGQSKVHVTVVIANRYSFDTEGATGKQIKEMANIPAGFALYRRVHGGNEPIHDDDPVELHDGDHFFARPPRKRDEREHSS